MKKFVVFATIIFALVLYPAASWAVLPGFSGGVNNEYEYEEIFFLSGEPIKFVGSISVTERDRADGKTVSYKLQLVPADKIITGKLDRAVTYNTDYTKRTDKGQTIAQTTVTNYKETVTINGDRYILEDYQFSKSDVIDNRPAADFSSGNFQGRKYYSINKNEGTIIVDVIGGSVGYKNFWGSTETQLMDFSIATDREVLIKREDAEDYRTQISWQGAVQIQVADSMTKSLRYSDNEAHYSSFEGGHVRVTNKEMVSRYSYSLPRISAAGIPNNVGSTTGVLQLSKQMVPQLERLIVPRFRDIANHWSEDNIRKLYSLDVFDDTSQFFLPNIPMTRVEFTKGIIRASNMDIATVEDTRATAAPTRVSARGAAAVEPQQALTFIDVSTEHKDYRYIKEALDKGIISGVSADEFRPNDPLTRAQAITIMIRVLGFENKVPSPGYRSSFNDASQIPLWARDSIYVAREIGLVQGDSLNNVNPNAVMTRAEASAMLTRFLEFLERDLQRDYRENIILYN